MDGSTPIWQLTVDQLKELIQSAIVVSSKSEVNEDSYFNSAEAKDYLKVSKSTIARWKKEGYLNSEKFGGVLRFRKSDLDKILNSNN